VTIIARLLRYAAIGASLWYLAVYLAIAALRMHYPFDLEWMEGGSVDHVVRVMHHQALYIQPQVAFIPFEYPPLYFYVSALVAQVIGIGYFPLRLVSFASSLVCLACIYHIVRTETTRPVAGLLAAGLFAATFRISGGWLDLARVDSLFLALFLLAILILRDRTSTGSHVLAGLLLSLSFLTKQTALAMAAPVVLYAIVVRRRPGLWLAATLTAVVGISSALLHIATNGWYTVYVWEFPFKHLWAQPVWATFWTEDMFGMLPIAFTCALLMVAWQIQRLRKEALFWPAVFAGMIGAAYRSRLQTGGYDNVLLPAYAVTAILVGLAAGTLVERARALDTTRDGLAEAAIYAACLIQMALLGYDPGAQLPRAVDRAAGDHLLTVLAAVPGDVLVPYHGYLSTAAGKPSHAHLMQVHDILKFGDERSAKLADQFRTAIRHRAFDAIVLDDTTSYYFMQDVDAAYVMQAKVFSDPGVFLPVTGGIIGRPEFVYVPRAGIARQ
jgi:dolichyl-phosphate-mannose-protein mannosyltransferase